MKVIITGSSGMVGRGVLLECLESDVNRKSDKLIKLNNIHSLEWEGIFLSPNHPKVNNHLLNVFKEILNQYNLDGFF